MELKLDQPVIGYRAWSYYNRRLIGLNASPWNVGVNTAKCFAVAEEKYQPSPRAGFIRLHPHLYIPAPVSDCTCGLHAYRNLFPLETWLSGLYPVIGSVLLYGKMFAGNSVIRAEKAEILALQITLPASTTEGISIFHGYRDFDLQPNLSSLYQVPLVSNTDDLKTIALEHGKELELDEL